MQESGREKQNRFPEGRFHQGYIRRMIFLSVRAGGGIAIHVPWSRHYRHQERRQHPGRRWQLRWRQRVHEQEREQLPLPGLRHGQQNGLDRPPAPHGQLSCAASEVRRTPVILNTPVRTHSRIASVAVRGRASSGYFSSKYGSARSAQSAARYFATCLPHQPGNRPVQGGNR